MLMVCHLDPRTAPVIIDVVFSGAWSTHPLRPLLAGVLAEMAARIDSMTPLAAIVQPFSAFVDGDQLPGLPLDPDTIRVFVGDDPPPGTLGEAAPGGWLTTGDPLPRSWGGWMDLRPTLDPVTLGTVARHELGHVLGVGHLPDPLALMGPYVGIGEVRYGTQADVAAFAAVGWRLELPTAPPPSPAGWRPFPTFAGEVRLASADVTGDGVEDLVAAAGPGGGPHVKVRDGVTGAEVASFYAYSPDFAGGVNMAAGDLDGDGRAEIVTGAGPGGGPHVKAFDGRTLAEVRSEYAAEPTVQTGVSVAVAGGQVVTIVGGVVR